MSYTIKKESGIIWDDWNTFYNSITTGTLPNGEAWEDEDWVEDDDNDDNFFIEQEIPIHIQNIVGIREHWEAWHNQQLLIINRHNAPM